MPFRHTCATIETMPAPVRRQAAPAPAPATSYGMFGELGFYSAGGINLPDGNYLWRDPQVVMFQPTKQDGTIVGNAFLSVQITLEPLEGAKTEEEKHVQQWSMGSKAHLSWMPDPETGTKIIPVPNGPAAGMNDSTNWAMLHKSLYDAGMPAGIFTDDLAVLDGIQAYMANIPEPESRKSFGGAKTGEAAEEARRPKTILVVQEILEGGAPWEAPPAPAARRAAPARAAVAAPATPVRAAAPARRAAPAPVPVAAAEEVDEEKAIIDAVSDQLGTAPAGGISKLKLRAACFKQLQSGLGDAATQAIMDAYWTDDAAASAILNQLGYKIVGPNVVVA